MTREAIVQALKAPSQRINWSSDRLRLEYSRRSPGRGLTGISGKASGQAIAEAHACGISPKRTETSLVVIGSSEQVQAKPPSWRNAGTRRTTRQLLWFYNQAPTGRPTVQGVDNPKRTVHNRQNGRVSNKASRRRAAKRAAWKAKKKEEDQRRRIRRGLDRLIDDCVDALAERISRKLEQTLGSRFSTMLEQLRAQVEASDSDSSGVLSDQELSKIGSLPTVVSMVNSSKFEDVTRGDGSESSCNTEEFIIVESDDSNNVGIQIL
jgi:hypothetical protein